MSDNSGLKGRLLRNAATYVTLFALTVVGIFMVREMSTVRSSSLLGLTQRKSVTIIGHRGTRGLMPENTIPAFLYGISVGAEVIEMDVYITNDGQVVVAHDPSLNWEFCTDFNGHKIPNTEYSLKHYLMKNMNYSDIGRCDCGRKNIHFPTQTYFPIAPPLMSDMFDAVETFVKNNNKGPVNYLIEIKTNPSWDQSYTPPASVVAQKVYDVVKAKNLLESSIIQSFDVRPLQHIRSIDNKIRLGLLTGNDGADVKSKLTQLGFVPYSYGPAFTVISGDMINYCHSIGIKVFGWTVNEASDMHKLIDLGIDGIISDYPDRVKKVIGFN
jgi:glycerophosphoryl diester phosphodiesterase